MDIRVIQVPGSPIIRTVLRAREGVGIDLIFLMVLPYVPV